MNATPTKIRWRFLAGRGYVRTALPSLLIAELRALTQLHARQTRIAMAPLFVSALAFLVCALFVLWSSLKLMQAHGTRQDLSSMVCPMFIAGLVIVAMLGVRMILKPSANAPVRVLETRVFPLLARVQWAPGADVTLELGTPGAGRWITVSGWLSSGVAIWMARDNHSSTYRGVKKVSHKRSGGRSYKVTKQRVTHTAWAVDRIKLSFDPSRFPQASTVAATLRQQTEGLARAEVIEEHGAIALAMPVALEGDNGQPQNSLSNMLETLYAMLDPTTRAIDRAATPPTTP